MGTVFKTIGLSILGFILIGCGFLANEPTPQVVTATPIFVDIAPLPTATPSPVIIQSTMPATVSTNIPTACNIDSTQPHIRYEVVATLDWSSHLVQVEQTILYRNETNEPLTKLVLHLEPNRFLNVMNIYGILSNESELINDFRVQDTRLDVPLPETLLPGCLQNLKLTYSLQLPSIDDTEKGRYGYFGYSNLQINLGEWLATMGIYVGNGEWYTPFKFGVGEQTNSEIADYSVALTVNNLPVGLQVAGPGTRARPNGNTWTFELLAARDFAVSLSDRFQVVSVASNNVSVELYFIPATQPAGLDTPDYAVSTASRALQLYSEKFGAYPYERLVIVEGDFPDGMEFTGLTFVGDAWFRIWKGKPDDWLTIITVHEVAHQWWYAMVGNDQANNPYLDEMLATYSELLYFERYHPDKVKWWWDFRVFTYSSQDFVDSTVYEFNGSRPYINAIYLRGVQMLDAARKALGDDAFFRWLYHYAETGRGKIATPQDFWGSLSVEDYAKLKTVRETYLQEPNILPEG